MVKSLLSVRIFNIFSVLGLGVHAMSYNGHIRIGILADRTLLPYPDILVDLFVDQVKELSRSLTFTYDEDCLFDIPSTST